MRHGNLRERHGARRASGATLWGYRTGCRRWGAGRGRASFLFYVNRLPVHDSTLARSCSPPVGIGVAGLVGPTIDPSGTLALGARGDAGPGGSGRFPRGQIAGRVRHPGPRGATWIAHTSHCISCHLGTLAWTIAELEVTRWHCPAAPASAIGGQNIDAPGIRLWHHRQSPKPTGAAGAPTSRSSLYCRLGPRPIKCDRRLPAHTAARCREARPWPRRSS
jgi:hypothetical protein